MLKEKEHITKASVSTLKEYQSEIKDLMTESWQISFPNLVLEKSNIQERFDKLVDYLENNTGFVLIAIEEGKLQGYIWYFITTNNRIHVNQIITSPNSRGKGIGTKLMETLYEEAAALDISEIELYVTSSNEGAIQFYERENFKSERILLKKDIG